MMRLDDGATDRQANPHTAGLGRVERFEEFIHRVGVETLPRVPVSRAPSTFGGSAFNIRRHVLALVMMPESGWLTSWAIDAVNAPRLMTLATCASSDRALSSASSASRR